MAYPRKRCDPGECMRLDLEAANRLIELKVLAVITPKNVALGHTWLKRKIKKALTREQ